MDDDGSWWTVPMSRETFNAIAAKRRPIQSNSRQGQWVRGSTNDRQEPKRYSAPNRDTSVLDEDKVLPS